MFAKCKQKIGSSFDKKKTFEYVATTQKKVYNIYGSHKVIRFNFYYFLFFIYLCYEFPYYKTLQNINTEKFR